MMCISQLFGRRLIGLVLRCQRQDRLLQDRVGQRQRNQTPERIFFTVVDDEQFADTLIIYGVSAPC